MTHVCCRRLKRGRLQDISWLLQYRVRLVVFYFYTYCHYFTTMNLHRGFRCTLYCVQRDKLAITSINCVHFFKGFAENYCTKHDILTLNMTFDFKLTFWHPDPDMDILLRTFKILAKTQESQFFVEIFFCDKITTWPPKYFQACGQNCWPNTLSIKLTICYFLKL